MPHTQRVTVMPACPASFFEERFPTSGNDKRCDNYYDAMFRTIKHYKTAINLVFENKYYITEFLPNILAFEAFLYTFSDLEIFSRKSNLVSKNKKRNCETRNGIKPEDQKVQDGSGSWMR